MGWGEKGMGKMSSYRLLLVNSRLGGGRERILSPELSRSLLVQGMEVPFTFKSKE